MVETYPGSRNRGYYDGGEQLSRAETTRSWIRVVVWDEQQPEQKPTYANFLGNEIAGYLQSRPGLKVCSVNLDDEQQGLSAAVLDACDVLVFGIMRAIKMSVVHRVRILSNASNQVRWLCWHYTQHMGPFRLLK